VELLDALGLPGMRILQFAFDGRGDNPFLPHRYPEACVAYTGTHDNDTTLGWWRSAPDDERQLAERYLGADASDPVEAFLRTLWGSRAMFAIAPLQDLLRLDTAARMNLPGTASGNWRWRLSPGADLGAVAGELRALNAGHGRAANGAAQPGSAW